MDHDRPRGSSHFCLSSSALLGLEGGEGRVLRANSSAPVRCPHLLLDLDRKPDSSLSTISELEDLADAMIGFPGFGLSVEARKRLTIGVELASKPQLLLFLDEVSLDRLDLYKCTFFSRISFCTAYVGS